jgi:hypothetical protein
MPKFQRLNQNRSTAMWLVVLATVLTAAVTLPAISEASRARCQSPGSRTVVSSSHARVFAKVTKQTRLNRETSYYGCLFSVGRKYRIGIVDHDAQHSFSLSPMRLRGRYVGFADQYGHPAGGTYAAIRVVDLRTGEQLHGIDTPRMEDLAPELLVTDLVLRPNGNVAWILTKNRVLPRPVYDVYKHDPSAPERQRALDSSRAIDPNSLTLAGSTVRWSKRGVRRSATLD